MTGDIRIQRFFEAPQITRHAQRSGAPSGAPVIPWSHAPEVPAFPAKALMRPPSPGVGTAACLGDTGTGVEVVI